ncbi:putative peptidoglycan binding domain containing protein [Neofusicoccum parvum UCRNP2]|uniref:Putative peptidoglycan binding domain containing protein n=1 Tax=Botryosphaeria parva (strain UCR-NP2) TaxID=1287680 RepID=R1G930_BOTPV|nr:putative peptidoglycan binding domain containing protein [Neofusicoccum parvum UCRNP2]
MKRLILCCDGSWTRDSPSSSPSNVARFSRMLARHAPIDDVAQIVFYQSGTSSSSTSSSNIDADGPLAADIAAAYHFLATNFSPGDPAAGVPADDIAVFGAGRGALVARAVVALALALDEHRAAFKPALWHLDPRYLSKTGRTPNLKQCWFPGFHETVGGNGGESGVSMKDGKDIADITLAWMCDQVDGLLAFNDAVVAEFLLGADESSSAQSSSNSTPTKPSRSTSNTSTSTNDAITIPQGPRTAGATTTSLLVQVFVHLLHTLLSTIIAALISLTQPTLTIPDNPGHNSERHAIRTPGQYHKNLEFDALATANDFPTNESIHPSVAHRADLFALAAVPYEPAPLREWPAATTTVIAATANHQRHGSGVVFPATLVPGAGAAAAVVVVTVEVSAPVRVVAALAAAPPERRPTAPDEGEPAVGWKR